MKPKNELTSTIHEKLLKMSGTSKEVNSPRRSIKDRLGPRSSDDKFIRHKSLGDDYSKSSQRHKEVCIQYVVFTLFV